MTRRTLTAAALLVAAAVSAAAGDSPAPQSKAAKLVARLGSPAYADREAASRELAALGAEALDELRAGCDSADAEVASRSRDLLAAFVHRTENDKALAPKMVDLSAADAPLDEVLADLSKLSGYEVLLGGAKRGELGTKKVTVKTGRVPFWAAVLAVCDAAEVQIASVGNVMAFRGGGMHSGGFAPPPGAFIPPPPGGGGRVLPPGGGFAPPGVGDGRLGGRDPVGRGGAIVLEPRTGGKKRPAVVVGAVCVEALELPGNADSRSGHAALLQAWPEPRLVGFATRGVSVTRSAGDGDALLTHHYELPYNPAHRSSARPFRDPLGNVVMIHDGVEAPPPPFNNFTLSPFQAAVKFNSAGEPPARVKTLAGSLFAVVKSGVEPVAFADLVAGYQMPADSRTPALSMKAKYHEGDADTPPRIVVDYHYDGTVTMAQKEDNLGVKSSADPKFNGTVQGFRVTGADGEPLSIHYLDYSPRSDHGTGRLLGYTLTLGLGSRDAKPRGVAFWGTYLKPVEMPFELTDVPLLAGPK